MEFPRFTQGNVGAMTFAHVNAVFERIERLEAQAGVSPSRKTGDKRGRALTVKVLAFNPQGLAAWEEVSRGSLQFDQWVTVQGGARSARGDDLFATPLKGTGFDVGSIVYAFQRNTDSGMSYLEAIQPRLPQWFYIQGHSGNAPVWTYYGFPAQWFGGSPPFSAYNPTNDPSIPPTLLYNGAENPVDDAQTVGVGTVKPNGVTMVRQPIKPNTVVFAVPEPNGRYVFCVPNGYQVTCG
jgi:hypothetical protein